MSKICNKIAVSSHPPSPFPLLLLPFQVWCISGRSRNAIVSYCMRFKSARKIFLISQKFHYSSCQQLSTAHSSVDFLENEVITSKIFLLDLTRHECAILTATQVKSTKTCPTRSSVTLFPATIESATFNNDDWLRVITPYRWKWIFPLCRLSDTSIDVSSFYWLFENRFSH